MESKKRKTAADFDQRILEIFDGYVHGKITKRAFISQAGKFAAVGVTGAMMAGLMTTSAMVGVRRMGPLMKEICNRDPSDGPA